MLKPEEGGGGPDLENSIAIALTVVFILPELRPPAVSEQQHAWTYFNSNDVCIGLLFVGHILASISHSKLDDPLTVGLIESGFAKGYKMKMYGIIGFVGLACVWVATVMIPIYNGIFYAILCHKLRKEGNETIRSAASKKGKSEKECPVEGCNTAVPAGFKYRACNDHCSLVSNYVAPGRPFAGDSRAPDQQGASFSRAVKSKLHAKTVRGLCWSPRCPKPVPAHSDLASSSREHLHMFCKMHGDNYADYTETGLSNGLDDAEAKEFSVLRRIKELADADAIPPMHSIGDKRVFEGYDDKTLSDNAHTMYGDWDVTNRDRASNRADKKGSDTKYDELRSSRLNRGFITLSKGPVPYYRAHSVFKEAPVFLSQQEMQPHAGRGAQHPAGLW